MYVDKTAGQCETNAIILQISYINLRVVLKSQQTAEALKTWISRSSAL